MSLDIYAKLKRGTIPSGQQLGTCYRFWSREERDRNIEPTNEVLWINITHNLGKMASKVPITEPLVAKKYRNLYYIMWRPEEVFTRKKVIKLKDLCFPLELGLDYVLSHEKELSKYNPENGWGHYENFVYCLPQYIRACYKWPNAILEVSR
jgi:hypothetical protein